MTKLYLFGLTLLICEFCNINARQIYAVGQQSREFTMPESTQNWQSTLHAGYATGSGGHNYAYVPREPAAGYTSQFSDNRNSANIRFVWGDPSSSAGAAPEYPQNSKYAATNSAVSPFGQSHSRYSSPVTDYATHPIAPKFGSGTNPISEYGRPNTKYGDSTPEYGQPAKYEGSSSASEYQQPSNKYPSSSSEYQQPSSKYPGSSSLAGNSDYSHLSKYAAVSNPAGYSQQANKLSSFSGENSQSSAGSPYPQANSGSFSNGYAPAQLPYSQREQSGSSYGQEGNSQISYAQPGQIQPHFSGETNREGAHAGRHSTVAELNPQESGQAAQSGSSSSGHGGWWEVVLTLH